LVYKTSLLSDVMVSSHAIKPKLEICVDDN